MRTLLIGLINVYRWFVSPLLGPSCRFHPSCSCYAQEAIDRHGVAAWHVARGAPDWRAAIPGIPAATTPCPDDVALRCNAMKRPSMANPRIYLWIAVALLLWMNLVQWNRDLRRAGDARDGRDHGAAPRKVLRHDGPAPRRPRTQSLPELPALPRRRCRPTRRAVVPATPRPRRPTRPRPACAS